MLESRVSHRGLQLGPQEPLEPENCALTIYRLRDSETEDIHCSPDAQYTYFSSRFEILRTYAFAGEAKATKKFALAFVT